MDFARKQLQKYGWADGKGLGKNEDGISAALKPKLKFDNAGIGHNLGEEFSNKWWENIYNNAAENIHIEANENDQIKLKLKHEESGVCPSSKHRKKIFDLNYGSFIKCAKLENGMEIQNSSGNLPLDPLNNVNFQKLTDEELFMACGGRTAHKAARHGLKLGGKLTRIEKQEKMLLKKLKKVSLSDNNEKEKNLAEKKLKKLRKQKEDTGEKYTPIMEDSMESTSSNGLKRKKKRKSVSFNETVTVTPIYTIDLDTSFESESGSIRDENSNESNLEIIASGSDEGIEQDIENNNNDLTDNHRSFEVAQLKISDLSKAERKKLKKKRKLDARKHTQTGVFLQKLNDEDFEDKINLKKRKFLDECDRGDCKRGYSINESPDKLKNKKNKKKEKKQRKMEEKMISIAKSLDNFCRISESE